MLDQHPLPRFRVWPDGTVQELNDGAYSWMSDDYQIVSASDEDEAREIVLTRGNNA